VIATYLPPGTSPTDPSVNASYADLSMLRKPSIRTLRSVCGISRAPGSAVERAYAKMSYVEEAEAANRMHQLLDLDPGRVAVVLVDFQRDFCEPPGTSANARAAVRSHRFAAEAARWGVRVIHSRQELDPDRLTHLQRRWDANSSLCVAGTPGADLFLPLVPGSRVVVKHRFDIWQSEEFLDVLAEWDIDGLVIGGVELQCCVLHAVLGAEERGFHYVIPQDLVSGIDRCEPTSNRAVRDYLRFAHPSPETSSALLDGWQQRASAQPRSVSPGNSP
jgi:nicotinamidase-related amidase